ncbi:glycosyltransferase family 4 protein [Sphingobium indicum]|uniref:Alpha-1,3-mannosyltransferase n=2 Tax=Sphingomonadaceae TaxID=41297 RepID=D4Z5H5_SPHIU|nr:alpha-1,3-mannosyltransferase [Sphingobium indicum UT26S]
MKIGIVSSTVPHINGGYRMFVDQLAPELEKAGHKVEKIWLPFSGDPTTMFEEMIGFRMMNLENICDMVICCRPPAHVIKHSRKVVWFIHHERIFYDLWDSEYNNFPRTPYWNSFRKNLMNADGNALDEAYKVFSNSKVVSDRLKNFNGIESEVLYPPLSREKNFVSHNYGSELLFVCRIEHHKRQHLALEAMAQTHTPVRLRIAGAASNSEYLASLHGLVRSYGLQDRVTIDGRWISEGEKRHLLSHALGVVYAPLDEDSYGYPTLEGAQACRPIISVMDSGGVREFVEDGKSGYLTTPEPVAIAAAFDRLWSDRTLAETLGRGARERIDALRINWDHVVARLTA